MMYNPIIHSVEQKKVFEQVAEFKIANDKILKVIEREKIKPYKFGKFITLASLEDKILHNRLNISQLLKSIDYDLEEEKESS